MRKNNPKYKQWLKNRQKHFEKKRKKKNIKSGRNVCNSNTYYPIESIDKNEKYRIKVPDNFSIKDNPKEVSEFFNKVIYFTNSKHKDMDIMFELSQVKNISADAIMYLIAVMQDLQKLGYARHRFHGDFPVDIKLCNYLYDIGFLNYVSSRRPKGYTNTNILQVIDKDHFDQKYIKQVCDFVNTTSNLTRKDTRFLYVLITEMMTNTCEHAYIKRSQKLKKWYLCAQKDANLYKFTFIDIGEGIPNTVQRKTTERIFKSESSIISSALNGEFRTQTKQGFRGKGLPKIKACVQEQNLENFTIISNKGYCRIHNDDNGAYIEENELTLPIIGTVYYWEMTIQRREPC